MAKIGHEVTHSVVNTVQCPNQTCKCDCFLDCGKTEIVDLFTNTVQFPTIVKLPWFLQSISLDRRPPLASPP